MTEHFWKIFYAIVLVIIGILACGCVFGLWDFLVFANGIWTLLIIIPCLLSMYQFGLNVWNFCGLALGFLCLFATVGLLPYSFVSSLLFPGVLILIGSRILYHKIKRK